MSVLNKKMMAGLLGVVAACTLDACAVEGVGVDGAVDVGYGGGYYEPYGYDYGGWGPGYYVGPGRGGDGHRWGGDHGGGHGGGGPAFRSAPRGRGVPSMPGGSRGGGGGGHGGGGHH